ncbi:Pleiotropic drug resistance protein 3 [Morus notabilis]|uniref:Pleiotropic drug resistance protein 3 n=1 Tax=Morus notabilis TaxID=981085 RepID=W9RFG2_9ROSA|nr:Pleiotropic drug resistance protein 3 [Morus notabilis]
MVRQGTRLTAGAASLGNQTGIADAGPTREKRKRTGERACVGRLVIMTLITVTTFFGPQMDISASHSESYMGSLSFTLLLFLVDGFPEPELNAIPATILRVPFSFVQSLVWACLTYYPIGYTPEVQRFLYHLIILFAVHLASVSMLCFLASVFQSMVASFVAGAAALLLALLFGGFIIAKPSMPVWLKWGFWMLSTNRTIGQQTLESRGLNFDNKYIHWISLGALFGFTIVFNIGFTLALSFLKAPGPSHAIISRENLSQKQASEDDKGNMEREKVFQDLQYYVDTPSEMKSGGTAHRKQLLCDVSCAFRPGVLTALMGVSGAGKTTLLDVLSGRKTGGCTKGEIKIGGYRKTQETFARISSYFEQNDILSPLITVEESMAFSAWLRLPPQIDSKTKSDFVAEVLETVELGHLKDALVGIPGISGLSTEQRRRLTIAVELVANPSILFMDEPKTGLDARAAAIVMRIVRNVVDTGRTVVCTIHQPSIDIFEAFDELILLNPGGQVIYFGPLGQDSSSVVVYFECISGVPRIRNGCNPAAWMLEVTSLSAEAKLGIDFAQIYKESALYRKDQQNLSNILGSMYEAVMFLGISNCSPALPQIATERTVLYRERFAHMYSSWAYALAQVIIEVPYLFIQTLSYVIITYPMIGYYVSAFKVLWYFYACFTSLLYFNYMAMLIVSCTPNLMVAGILCSSIYAVLNLFSGFIIHRPQIPKWWIWLNYLTPTSWSMHGLLTSQYGDVDLEIMTISGETKTVSGYLQDYFGFEVDNLGLVAAIIILFPLVFASLFAYCTALLSFLSR